VDQLLQPLAVIASLRGEDTVRQGLAVDVAVCIQDPRAEPRRDGLPELRFLEAMAGGLIGVQDVGAMGPEEGRYGGLSTTNAARKTDDDWGDGPWAGYWIWIVQVLKSGEEVALPGMVWAARTVGGPALPGGRHPMAATTGGQFLDPGPGLTLTLPRAPS